MKHMQIVLLISILLLSLRTARAGYEKPCYIDGCQSVDGRFVITAELVESGKTVHGPHRWKFTWQDTKSGESKTFPAQGIQSGQIYGQLLIAPDGKTFALWNHVTLWSSEKSQMHGPKDLPHHEDTPAWRNRPEFSRRLIIYRNDGEILRELGIGDLILPEEWESVGKLFNRVHWIEPYGDLDPKATPRMQYAYYHVSPDYTVLEFQPIRSKAKRREPPRKVRVSLTDGRILNANEKLTEAQQPVRPYQGDDHLPSSKSSWAENYKPSLDSVRTAGTYRTSSATQAYPLEHAPKVPEFPYGQAKRIQGGFQKADTPSWLPNIAGDKTPGGVVLTDLEQGKLFLVDDAGKVSVLHKGLTRGKVGPDKRWYGLQQPLPTTTEEAPAPLLVFWKPGEEPQTILEKAAGGREVSLNDLAVSSRGLIYFTTLKDPEQGRLSVVDPQTKEVRVLFDGQDEPTLANPNGIALSPDERFLYVGISNYKNRKQSGVYAFPIKGNGTIDVATGKEKLWAAVPAPDGIAVDRGGNVYFTAGGVVRVFDRYGRAWGEIKIPQGSGTNLCFGSDRDEKLFVTTLDALYEVTRKE